MNRQHTEITICMGSSCFSRGNKRLLRLINEYLEERGLTDAVVFKGSHCMGMCAKGPVLQIGEEIFQHVDNTRVSGILDAYFSA